MVVSDEFRRFSPEFSTESSPGEPDKQIRVRFPFTSAPIGESLSDTLML